MEAAIEKTLEQIHTLARKYQNIPGKPVETADALLDEAELLRQSIDKNLSQFAAQIDELDPALVREIGDALQQAREASVTAEIYLQQELRELQQTMGIINTGKKARLAYQTPRVGMGYTEGSFIDRRK